MIQRYGTPKDLELIGQMLLEFLSSNLQLN